MLFFFLFVVTQTFVASNRQRFSIKAMFHSGMTVTLPVTRSSPAPASDLVESSGKTIWTKGPIVDGSVFCFLTIRKKIFHDLDVKVCLKIWHFLKAVKIKLSVWCRLPKSDVYETYSTSDCSKRSSSHLLLSC